MNKHHNVPFRKVQRWDGSGFGYHTQFGSPSHWTPKAKTCPGPDRIIQFNEILVPWLDAGAKMSTATVNITAALQADTFEERHDALLLVAEKGSDEASAIAKQWITAMDAAVAARAMAKQARMSLKDLEVKL